MVTFGYKKWFESVLRALIALTIGIVLIYFQKEGGEFFVQMTGIGILLAGAVPVFAILVNLLNKNKEQTRDDRLGTILGITVCVITTGIGLWMILDAAFFEKFFRYIIAGSVILFALVQIIALVGVMRLYRYASIPLIVVVLVLIGAVVVMFLDSEKAIYLTTGILLIIYALSELAALYFIKKCEQRIEAEVVEK